MERAGGRLKRVFFCSSGSEGVEAAIKFSRAFTRRSGLLYAENAFHGLTCGALSLMSDPFWREGFGPLLPDAEAVPFGSADALEAQLSTRKFAAFIVEPIQAEAGIRMPEPGYLKAAETLCRRYGTLFVLDEVQTGMYRTGPFLAAHRFGVEPDMVVLAKALSGGLIPVGALLTSEAVSDSVYSSLKRAIVHASTFGENALAMRAGLATLDVLEQESLGERAAALGDELRRRLTEALAPYEMVRSVRGEGMLSGIEFAPPRQLRLRVAFETFRRIHPAMFGQVLVMRMFRDHGILTQICGNNFMVLKVAPPLVVTEEQIGEFVAAVTDVVDLAHSSAPSGARLWAWPAARWGCKAHEIRRTPTDCFWHRRTGGNARGDPQPLLDRGYAEMYNLQFAEAHRTFEEWEKLHPQDPMGPVSDAAAWLFLEFDRLHILQSEFFTHDQHFITDHKLAPDPVLKQNFQAAIQASRALAARAPNDTNALFAALSSQRPRIGLLGADRQALHGVVPGDEGGASHGRAAAGEGSRRSMTRGSRWASRTTC